MKRVTRGAELAYVYQPVHNTLILANGRSPLTLRYANSGTSVLLRGKVRVGGRSKLSNGSGFWFSGGLGVIPNNGQSLDSLAFRGIIQRRRNTADTVRLAIDTYQNKRFTGLTINLLHGFIGFAVSGFNASLFQKTLKLMKRQRQ